MTTVDEEALAASLRRLQRRDERLDLATSLRHVLDSCVQLFAVDGSGLMIADEDGALRYAVATDGPGRLLEDAQLETGEGPCVDTFHCACVVRCRDVASDERYPKLGELMRDSGVGGVIGVPVQLAGARVGSLDLYRTRPTDWLDREEQALVQYGRVVETMMAAALDAHQAGELAAQLQFALNYRVPIERGVGYLMARDGVSSDAAFERLRAVARRQRRKVGEVAEELIATGRLPDEPGRR